MKILVAIGLGLVFLVVVCCVWMGRMTTNTAAGRFYKNDRWTWKTFVVEKNGDVHWLRPPEEKRD